MKKVKVKMLSSQLGQDIDENRASYPQEMYEQGELYEISEELCKVFEDMKCVERLPEKTEVKEPKPAPAKKAKKTSKKASKAK